MIKRFEISFQLSLFYYSFFFVVDIESDFLKNHGREISHICRNLLALPKQLQILQLTNCLSQTILIRCDAPIIYNWVKCDIKGQIKIFG